MTYPVEIVDYDPNWPKAFENEAVLIKKALGSNCIAVHHIGSTSVPGLSAKPILDILPVVKDIVEVDKAIKAMEALGYEAKGESGILFRRFFQKGKAQKTHNIHIYQNKDPEIERYLKFRDWLRTHEEDAKAYETLKRNLAKKYPHDISAYCNGKDLFVAEIDAKDGFEGWRVVKALTDREWEAVRKLPEQYFFKISTDPFTKPIDKPDHLHFVFYIKAEIIGYIHLQLWKEQKAALRMMVIDEPYRNKGFGSKFLNLCEKWLYQQGIRKIHLQCPIPRFQFFYDNNYREMPFDDPERYLTDPQIIEIGKILTQS